MHFVPVVDKEQKPLMPTTANRAATWIKSGKATPFWKRGIFCVRLNQEPSARQRQEIAVGIDPGSKKEGFTAKSESHTYLNLQADAVTWVKAAVETRRNLRRARRNRNTPCRKPRFNRARGGLSPSTKARWQWKLRLCKWLSQMYPITQFVVEDICARTKKGQRRWNVSFGPLEVGKHWFEGELKKLAPVLLVPGYETFEMRRAAGLKKSKQKMSEVFAAHCVDSWVLANHWTGGHIKPDSEQMLLITPLRFHRRQLHVQNFKDGKRKLYGGTRSQGFKRGSLVKHPKYGLCYIGGTQKSRVSLHSLQDGKRLGLNAKPEDIQFLTHNTWRLRAPLSVSVAEE